MVVYYCSLCRRSAFSGRRKHVYEQGHRERLNGVLRAFSAKVEAARKMIKVPSVVNFDPAEHEQTFWCYCCEGEVKRHTSDGELTVVHGQMLEHMFSEEHRKAVNKFWWMHQVKGKLKPHFVLSSEEYERFKSSVTKALENYEETEDVLIKQVAAQIREAENGRLEMLQRVLETVTDPMREEEQSIPAPQPTSSVYLEDPGPSSIITTAQGCPKPTGAGPPLTFLGHQVASSKLNVHTGAIPPWLTQDDDEERKKPHEIGPSQEDFLKHQEKLKLKKLPPNRVGANFDHSSTTHEGWLPSFGRVWNNGRRWQSRHQYRSETGEHKAKKKRW